MRTLADRHYADNWVVPWGIGCYTDLAVEWDSFPAARAALASAVSVTRARDVAAATTSLIPDLHLKIAAHLSKGHLTVSLAAPHSVPAQSNDTHGIHQKFDQGTSQCFVADFGQWILLCS